MIFLPIFLLTGLLTTDIDVSQTKIEHSLMAPCCWTSTIAEHSSDVAMEMKQDIRRMLSEGKTVSNILDSYEKKYGERILAQPKNAGFSMLVWSIPMLLFLIGSSGIYIFLRRKQPVTNDAPLSAVMTAEDDSYRRRINQELYGS